MKVIRTLISEDDNVKSETNFNYKLPIKKWDVVGNIIITINGKKTKKDYAVRF